MAIRFRVFLLVCGFVATPVLGRPIVGQTFDLSIPNIMRGTDLIGVAPGALRGGGVASWSPDSRFLYFRWQQPGVDTAMVPYRVSVPGGEPERMSQALADTVLVGNGVWSSNRRRAVFAVDGDLVLWENGRSRRLTSTVENESSALWSEDNREVFFQRDGNVFALEIEGGALRQLTDIRSGAGPRDRAADDPQREFLRSQEDRLIDFVGSDRYQQQPWFSQRSADSTRPQPFFPGEGRSVTGREVAPNGQYVVMSVVTPARNTRRVDMPVWITDDGYVGVQQIRTKVGDAQSTSRAGVLNTATGVMRFVADSVGQGARDVRGVAISGNSRYGLFRVETHDDEHRWYVVVDLQTLEERVVHHVQDSAWLGGPSYTTAGFLPDGETVYFTSEETGWAHLYVVPATGGTPRALTSGEWEVLDAEISPDGRRWHITANRDGFADVHLYDMPVLGGELRRITQPAGRQDVTVSPDGRWLAVQHSTANAPPELFVQENRPDRSMRQVTLSTTEEWRQGTWIAPEIVMVPTRDGTDVPARLYRPSAPHASGGRPAVVFVHGAGYLQNVHNWWSSYYREYMFHHFLASHGYTVIDLDYRGSAGHGRDWRTAIYRHMGGKDLTDNVDAANWLVQTHGVDRNRIGVYGGSYGGFITLMAMFTTPGVFEAGAALRPVTDWAHYNHGYTSNILNEPQNDSLAYQQSSPIYFAEGLEGQLLLAHGMVDDNVHFHDTVRLVQRLIELGKENWEVAIYPVERHGFTEASSWTDEYRRIFKLFEGM